MPETLDRINAGLALLWRIRQEHSPEGALCKADGQGYPCVTIQSLDEGKDDLMKVRK